eukprot:CAMPEP_0195621190 /NCGR_PEP_ID=MMETSP0815-20121206/15557_1 /TAXON_ID=97485 /ORGANISM="Prymnesium parvum, Strain Texoma1" /LENGTH=303 /DNA_ID=CAMNT_0040761923 /DNA_START=24 /DNA_END=935 /DNA_ORIENTATION=+
MSKAHATLKESLTKNKGMVLQAMANKLSNKFKAFCRTDMMDNFLIACIEYFAVFFEVQKQRTPPPVTEEAKNATGSQQHPATPPIKVDPKLEIEMHSKLRVMATVYAGILLKHSNYANTQQERQFFESLYDFSARVMFVNNDRKRWQMIENELSRVFRSEHFNLTLRKNEQSARGGGARGGQRDLHTNGARASRPTKAHHSSIHQALLIRSPIISTIFPTAKERAQRAADLLQGEDIDIDVSQMPTSAPQHRHLSPAASREARREEEELRLQNTLGRGLEGEEAMDAEIAMAESSFDALAARP